MQAVNSIATLLICGIVAIILLNGKMERKDVLSRQEETVKRPDGKKAFLILAVYGLIAVRLIGFGDIPGGINQDGAMGAVDARALADYGTDRFGTFMPAHFEAWGYGQMSVLLSYLTVPFIKLFGLTKIAVRLPILLASLMGIAAVYGLVKKIFGERAAAIVLLFLAVNPWHFMQSRWALDCNLFPHMFVTGLYFLVGGLKKKGDLYVSMIFFALCMYSYGVSFYMVPFFLLTACVLFFVKEKVTWRDILICLLIYFGIAWPICGTMLINFRKWDTVRLPFVTMQYFEGNVRSADLLFFSENMGQQFLTNLRSLVNVVFLQKEDLLWNSIREFGTLYKCTLPFVILGAALTVRGAGKETDENKKTACSLLLCYWIFALLTGLMINSVNVNRINIIFYIHIIFAAVGIAFAVKKWRASLYVISLVFGILSILFFHTYFTGWAQEIDKAFYGDFLDALAYVKEFDCDHYCITPDTQYEGAVNVTEILTLFAFDVDSKYYQGETDRFENKEIAYRERFLYGNPPEGGYIPAGTAAYVFKSSDQDKFLKNEFCVVSFGDYSAAVPWCYY